MVSLFFTFKSYTEEVLRKSFMTNFAYVFG